MDTKNKAVFLLVVDYLAQLLNANLITQSELDTAKNLAAIQYGIEDVWQ